MTDIFDSVEGVRAHYRATGLTDRLKTALGVFGPEGTRLRPDQLAPLDQFHTLGAKATSELATLAGIRASDGVLDVGSGIGGPARFLSATTGCRVHGVDLSEPFVDAAQYLTDRTGQRDRVSFEAGNALDLPVHDGEFDVAVLQHVAMNIADRRGLYSEIRRVLRKGGRFATFDVVAMDGMAFQPYFPLPWARTSETSFLLTQPETLSTVCEAGFRMVDWQDETEVAKAWVGRLRADGPPSAPNLSTVMGPDFLGLSNNLGRSLLEGRLGILSAVFQAIDPV